MEELACSGHWDSRSNPLGRAQRIWAFTVIGDADGANPPERMRGIPALSPRKTAPFLLTVTGNPSWADKFRHSLWIFWVSRFCRARTKSTSKPAAPTTRMTAPQPVSNVASNSMRSRAMTVTKGQGIKGSSHLRYQCTKSTGLIVLHGFHDLFSTIHHKGPVSTHRFSQRSSSQHEDFGSSGT